MSILAVGWPTDGSMSFLSTLSQVAVSPLKALAPVVSSGLSDSVLKKIEGHQVLSERLLLWALPLCLRETLPAANSPGPLDQRLTNPVKVATRGQDNEGNLSH